jgi:ABC-2 type transport system ATP-binding protein
VSEPAAGGPDAEGIGGSTAGGRTAAGGEAAGGEAGGGEERGGEAVLSAEGIVKRYGAREALCGVSFQARRGELVAVIGPNGAGKTTLLSILAGVQSASAGRVGHAAAAVGWVPQQPAVYAKLTVAENLRLFARLERVPDPESAVGGMLAQTELQERADEQVGLLSGGNRQRVNIAVGLLSEPAALLLDEPSAALDPRQRGRLWRFIRDLAERGTSVIFSTHNVAEAERHATRVIVLADGELLFDGLPGALMQEMAGDGAPMQEMAGERSQTNRGGERDAGGKAGRDLEMDFEEAFVAFLHRRGH